MSGKSGRGARRRAALPECLSILSGGNGLSGVLDENNCYICSLELRYGVMVALQILVLSAQVRILVPQLSLRGISPDPCGAQVAFRLCVAKSRDRAGALMSTF